MFVSRISLRILRFNSSLKPQIYNIGTPGVFSSNNSVKYLRENYRSFANMATDPKQYSLNRKMIMIRSCFVVLIEA